MSASAYWTASGSGSAVTVLPDTLPITFSPGVPTGQLYPGDDASVAIVVHNPNPFFVQIESLQLDSSAGAPFVVDSEHSGCDVAVISFIPQDNDGLGWSLPPKVGSVDGTSTINMASAMRMSAAAANACQGATFTVRLKAPS